MSDRLGMPDGCDMSDRLGMSGRFFMSDRFDMSDGCGIEDGFAMNDRFDRDDICQVFTDLTETTTLTSDNQNITKVMHLAE